MKLLMQIAIIFSVCLAGEGIALLLPFAFPGSVIGMILLFLLLLTVLRVEHIQIKTDFLLKNMAFFFIPAGVSIMGEFSLLWQNIVPVIVICVVSTLLTFGATALTVRGAIALQEHLRRKKGDAKHAGVV